MEPLDPGLAAEILATTKRYKRASNWLRTLPLLPWTASSVSSTEASFDLVGPPAIVAVAALVSPDAVYIDGAVPMTCAWELVGATLTVRRPQIDYTDRAREVFAHFDLFRRGGGPDPRRNKKRRDPWLQLWAAEVVGELARTPPRFRMRHAFEAWPLAKLADGSWHHLRGLLWPVQALRYSTAGARVHTLAELVFEPSIAHALVELPGPRAAPCAFGDAVARCLADKFSGFHRACATASTSSGAARRRRAATPRACRCWGATSSG